MSDAVDPTRGALLWSLILGRNTVEDLIQRHNMKTAREAELHLDGAILGSVSAGLSRHHAIGAREVQNWRRAVIGWFAEALS